MANRSNHRSRRSNASTAPGMPLRVPAAASALALVLALSAPPAAHAQAASQSSSADSAQQAADASVPPKKSNKNEVLQEVVVTGLRQSLMSSEAIKRLSPQIVDAVSAEDIGALPDRSVAEALERIPGVLIERTDNNRDPARLTDAGGNVFIRGLSWVKSELDGEEIFSANDGRDISFEDISPDLLSAIKVYKSPTADQIEGGIGGVIDMETRKPLESRHNLTAFSADYEYGDMIKKGFPAVNGLWSNYWDTDIGKVGVLLSGTYAQEGNRTDSIQLGDYIGQILPAAEGGQQAGATVYVPNDMAWRRLDWKQNRQALDGVFQWESPGDTMLLTVHAFQTKDNPQNLENTEGALGGEYLGSPSGSAIYGTVPSGESYTAITNSGVVTAGTVGIEPTLDTRYEKDHHSTDMFTVNLQWKPTERLTLSNDLQYEKSHADMVSMTAFTAVGNPDNASGGIPVDTTLNFNLAGNTPYMALSQTPYSMTNPADYWWYAAMDHIEDNDAHQWADRLDGTLKFEDNSWLTALRAGARFTDRQAITRESNWNWNLLSAAYYWGGTPVTLTQTPGWASSYQPFNNFMRGSISQVAPGWFPSYQLVRNGTAYACSVLCPTENAGYGWTPLTTNWSKYNPGTGDNPINGINDQEQHTYAGYVSADFHHDTPVGPMDGNIGLRVVRTVQAAANGDLDINAGTFSTTPAVCDADLGAAACAFFDNAYNFEGVGTGTPGGTFPYTFPANTYTNVLPSLNMRFSLTNDLQWRVAASQSVTPPPFSDMIPFATVSYNFVTGTPLPALVNSMTGTSGNPELKPTRSNDFDTSLEWYFAPSGDLTFDIFYKDIHNYILTGTVATTLTHNGVTQTFPVTMYENGAHGSVKGFELAYQQFYTFLPSFLQGFGLQGNLTFVDDTGGSNTAQNDFDTNQVKGADVSSLPMEGMSRWSYNAALMYQAHRLEGRLAWNWRERYLLTTSAANLNEPVWMDNYGQLDAELFYDITDYLKVGLQGTNLLETRTYLDVGPGPNVGVVPRYSWTDTDRTIAAAIRLQF